MAFLAIPGVYPENNNTRTAAQIVSYISIATSTGSIIIGLLLGHQNRVKPGETVDQAVRTACHSITYLTEGKFRCLGPISHAEITHTGNGNRAACSCLQPSLCAAHVGVSLRCLKNTSTPT